MKDRLFDRPIFVSESVELVREVGSVLDAIDFLEEWPHEMRDLVHETVLSACYDALEDRKPVAAVEKAFTLFAKRAGIFEDPEAVMPWIGAATGPDGQVPA